MLALAAAPAEDLGDLGFTLFYSSIKPKIDALLAAVNVLNGDITKWYAAQPKNTTTDNFANGWISWRDTFYGWYKYATERWSSITPPLPWALEDDVNVRTADLTSWRKQWETMSGLAATGPNPEDSVRNAPSGTNWWLWGGLLAAGAIGAVILVKKFSPQMMAIRALTARPVPAAVSGARRRARYAY